MLVRIAVVLLLAFLGGLVSANTEHAGKSTLKVDSVSHREAVRRQIEDINQQISDLDLQINNTRGQVAATRGVFGISNPQSATLAAHMNVFEMRRDELASRKLDLEDSLME